MAIVTSIGIQCMLEGLVPLHLAEKLNRHHDGGITFVILGLVFTTMVPIVGHITDRLIEWRGETMRYYVMMFGSLATIAAAILMAFAKSFAVLMVGYSFFAVADLCMFIPAQSAYGDFVNGENVNSMARGYSIATVAWALGAISLPPIGSALYSQHGFSASVPDLLQNTMGVARSSNGIVAAAFGVGGLLAGLFTGYLSDHTQNRVGFQLLASVLYIVSGLVLFYAKKFYQVVLFRLVLGISSSMADTMLFTTVADVYPADLLGFKMAIIFVFDHIGNMLGPLLGGKAYEHMGVSGIALISIALGVFELLLVAVFVRNSIDIRHALLAIETHMAKTPRNVFVLLEELRKKLTPIARAELKELQKLKQADSKASNPSEIFEWDRVYYQHKHLMETLGSVDIREYFPLPQVLRGMFTIYEKMLGVRVVKEESANAWHPDVELYTVREANSNEHVGSIFLDLYERDGKTALNAMHKIKPGYKSEDGTFVTSKVAITTSFSQPVAQKPTLLKHRDLQMLIHELGHAFHEICARSKWSALQGTAASSDYSEAISQMMENWVWETSVLRTFAFHYQTGDPMPEDMLQKLVASKMKWQGIDALHLIALSLFDLSIHDKGLRKLNVAEHYNKTLEQVSLVKRGKHHTFGAASFSHIGNASGSTFYCYIWSRVYAADMFVSRFVKGGLSNPQTGSDFRKEVLQPGYSRDLMGNLVRFLGRNPNSQAYLGMFEE
ncbi:Thimet oligopeptidase [Coemansia sp. RSA 989]|nr:Thimet oligopeptidase [Coemansia sp. RSA 989]